MLLAKDKNWENLIVETDYKVAMGLIGKNEELEHPMSHIIEECKKIMEFLGASIQHTWREGNFCANAMAKLGGMHSDHLKIFCQPPIKVKHFLFEDLTRVTRVRA